MKFTCVSTRVYDCQYRGIFPKLGRNIVPGFRLLVIFWHCVGDPFEVPAQHVRVFDDFVYPVEPANCTLESLACSQRWLGCRGQDKSHSIMTDQQIHHVENRL